MTAANLAIVFGPNLLRPHVENIETSLNVPKMNLVIGDMIEQADAFFC
jgi:hypothetical protein